ncbi:MAG TPA: hypothetical protein VEO00_06605, partial [Actinomycetota bacterium]|nr:hypothetical protein [Actinomycetota bacterium]
MTAAAVGDTVYVVGGFVESGATVRRVEAYDGAAGAWSVAPPLPIAANHAMSAGAGRRLVVAGGYRGPNLSNPTDRAFVFLDGRWRELPRMPETRAAGGAAVAAGRLYVVGGTVTGTGDLARTTLVYTFASGRWSTAPGLPTRREHLGVAAFGGKVYAVGGRTGG